MLLDYHAILKARQFFIFLFIISLYILQINGSYQTSSKLFTSSLKARLSRQA